MSPSAASSRGAGRWRASQASHEGVSVSNVATPVGTFLVDRRHRGPVVRCHLADRDHCGTVRSRDDGIADTIKLRAPTVADAEIARVVNAHGVATTGDALETAAGVSEWFDLSEVDPAEGMRVAVDTGGAIIGYGDVTDDARLHQTYFIDLRDPDAQDSAPILLDALSRGLASTPGPRAAPLRGRA